jgi:hypothetical protein
MFCRSAQNEKREAFGFPFVQFGAGDEARTRDLNLGKVALYQLSYSREEISIVAAFSVFGRNPVNDGGYFCSFWNGRNQRQHLVG